MSNIFPTSHTTSTTTKVTPLIWFDKSYVQTPSGLLKAVSIVSIWTRKLFDYSIIPFVVHWSDCIYLFDVRFPDLSESWILQFHIDECLLVVFDSFCLVFFSCRWKTTFLAMATWGKLFNFRKVVNNLLIFRSFSTVWFGLRFLALHHSLWLLMVEFILLLE